MRSPRAMRCGLFALLILSACDGRTYPDVDGDGYPAIDDCDDDDKDVNPDATEICDGIDDDCDGAIDEGEPPDAPTWFADVDADGFGDANSSTSACSQPSGFVVDATDCDDARALSNPEALEYCDGVDDDCDGAIDEADAADASTWFADVDADGFGDANWSTGACSAARWASSARWRPPWR